MGSAAVAPVAGQYSQLSTQQGLATAPSLSLSLSLSLSRQQVCPDECAGTNLVRTRLLTLEDYIGVPYGHTEGNHRSRLSSPYYLTRRRIRVRETLSG